MKKTKLAALAATLTLAMIGSASMALAWDHGGYHRGAYGYPSGGPALSAEQQTMNNDFNKKAGPLAAQLRAKQAELDALYAQGQPDAAKAGALAKEIGDLQGRLYQMEAEYGSQMRNSGYAGDAYGWGHRGGRGHGGHHGGHRW